MAFFDISFLRAVMDLFSDHRCTLYSVDGREVSVCAVYLDSTVPVYVMCVLGLW